ncbi:MFS transporter [Streptomyces sp. NBC_00691]|uniref:MFS transporter n=1 Tax=Streptomyces sp. NBC_00691 TaxID=2903671 RepID=UPI002E36692B|nr:MFS transporter [Streptomyces sp. NBC_00691]
MEQLTGEDPAYIGPYRLIARLGAGGMGLVYLGRSDVGRTVAVKVVQAEHAQHPEFRRRFAREVAAARRVGGDWTADVLDADTEAVVPWVATQYIPGPDLSTVVAQDFGPLPERSVRLLANRLALALRAVHEAGLIHRDLKPSNVLVTVDGPRVIDFGIARAMDSLAGDSLHTRTGMLIGSPGFMSPEQVRGLELTPASDVFCLGALLVYAATGRLLFGATETGLNAHLFRIAEEEADLTGVPDTLVELVRACLDKDPVKRPTPQEVAERTEPDQAGEWLPGAVLAQLGRRAAHLLDYAPVLPAGRPAVVPDPRGRPAQPLPPRPAYTPTASAHSGSGPGFGAPQTPGGAPQAPGTPPGAWGAPTAAARPTDPSVPLPRRRRGLVMVALAQFAVLFDAASFTAAMWMGGYIDLGFGPRMKVTSTVYLELLPSLYVLAFVVTLLFGGLLADRVGRKRTLMTGLVGFVVAAVVVVTAPSYDVVIVARVVQGVFAALVSLSAPLLVSASFTDREERRKAFGIHVMVAGSGPALGLLAGWLLLDSLAWRVCVLVVVPLALVAVVGTATQVRDRTVRLGAPFDVPGVLLGFGAIAAVGGAVPYFTNQEVVLPLASGILMAAFVWWQTRTAGVLAPLPGGEARAPAGYVIATALVGIGVGFLVATTGHGYY